MTDYEELQNAYEQGRMVEKSVRWHGWMFAALVGFLLGLIAAGMMQAAWPSLR
jgi:hypothetical protein